MTGFKGLRLAREGDEERLMVFCREAHADNGFRSFDEDQVRSIIDQACRGERYVFAIADGPERIEAGIALQPNRLWWSGDDGWHYTDLLVWVHALHRRSWHAFRLLRFARWWADKTGVPVFLSVLPRTGLIEKTALYVRFGKLVATTIQVGTWK